MRNGLAMEERERKTSASSLSRQNRGPPTSGPTANGRAAGSTSRAASANERGARRAGEGFAGIAKILSSKAKSQGNSDAKLERPNGDLKNHAGFDDDLPLGSEAHSLSFEHTNGIDSRIQIPTDKRSKWLKTASQSIMGWQSFNSDVSNQTSASSASLEMLLNERQMDPEEMLLSLGFGGETQNYVPTLARVPERFLRHPSRAYGIAAPGSGEEGEGEAGEEDPGTAGGGGVTPSASPAVAGAAAAIPPPKKRTGIWTLARTLSLFRMRATPSVSQVSASTTPSGTPPLASQILSILHPTNQRYLASRGYYQKQGWPSGTFLESDEASLEANEESEEAQDAASKRKMFQKTRSRRNWSMCGSGDENEAPSQDSEWITKSMDDSLSREDIRDSSLGRGTYFSTTTESSTDSLDGPTLETERAFEEIRRQYNESRGKERSSSEDLFLPRRRKRMSSDAIGEDESLDDGERIVDEEDTDFLSTNTGSNTNYFVSPASSRQATVEKAPTITEHSNSIYINEDGEYGSKNDDNNNKHRSRRASDLNEQNADSTREPASHSDVRIIVSSSETTGGRSFTSGNHTRAKSPSKLCVEGPQRTSSDSGSSSSNSTAIATATDDVDTLRFSESENSVTDKDSISRTHSPCGFGPGPFRTNQTASSSCQTLESDFRLAAELAANEKKDEHSLGRTRGSGVNSPIPDRRQKDGLHLEDVPKVQLSPLPTAINPVELMRRLQHSQDELSRMGSVQSDSSGFGDADPAAEPGTHEMENLKIASMGSSGESCGTMASSATTAIFRERPGREMATQTSVESSKVQSAKDRHHLTGDKSDAKQSPRPSHDEARYVTMCYIPARGSLKNDQSEGLRYRGSGGRPVQSTFISEFPPQRPRGDSEPVLDFGSRGYFPGNDHSYARPRGNSDVFSDFPRFDRPNYDPRWRDYEDEYWDPPRMYSSLPREHYSRRNYDRQRQYEQVGGYPRRGSPVVSRGLARERSSSTSSAGPGAQKIYRSHIDLYASETGLHKRYVSYGSHTPAGQPRRHSDEGILEGRNDKPLSEELAMAMGSGGQGSVTGQSSTSASQTTTVTSSTTAASSGSSSTSNNIISSTSIFIHSRPNTTATTATPSTQTLATPAHYKTEAGFHFPPLAGNLSGLQTDHHSTPFHSKPFRLASTRQRSCDVLEDDFIEGDPISAPEPGGEPLGASTHRDYIPPSEASLSLRRFPSPGGAYASWQEPSGLASRHLPTYSRMSDEMETYSSVAESSSDFSIQSTPEGHTRSGILDSRKLARLINQPVYFKGTRRSGCHYRPRRLFKEWSLLSKRKRLQEENRLLQYTIQKYKTDLSVLETSFMVDYQTAYAEMTDEEREEVEELEWLWGEVRGQVMEMERLLVARIKSVHAGNDFHSLMSNMGIINKTIELIKEQIYQQQIANNRVEEGRDPDLDDDPDLFDSDPGIRDQRSGSFRSSHSWMSGPSHMSSPQLIRRGQSSSTSHLPSDLNVSLEQMKSSLLSQVHQEIKESTRKLELDLQVKDKEIKQLREELASRSFDSAEKSPKRWTPKHSRLRSSSDVHRPRTRTHSRSRVVGDIVVQETDV